jgi:lipid-A-disaccharide synthase
MPELIQKAVTPESLAGALARWLDNSAQVAAYRDRCAGLHLALRNDAGRAAAAAVLEIAGAKSRAGEEG